MRTSREPICCIFLLVISAAASATGTNYTVQAGGGGNYTTIQACATAMSSGDTCTVYAGTYNEFVSSSNAVNECSSIFGPFGDHFLIENNDFSHYTTGINFGANFTIFRNNTFHDQYETEAGGNQHTDAFFSEPGSPVPYTVEY